MAGDLTACDPPTPALLAELAPPAPVWECEGLVAHQSADVFELWRRWEAECGRRCGVPFWAVVWPGAAMIARHVLRHPAAVAARRVLDLGCGGAIAAIAALRAGAASAIANDVDAAALHVARLNAAANHVVLECRGDDLLASGFPPVDVVLVGDMFYEKVQAESTLARLRLAHSSGTMVLIADAGRPFAPRAGVELLACERVPVSWDLEGVREREVRLLSLVREA